MSTVSDITVASLAATPGIGYIGLTWTYSDPRSGALPNLALDMVEVWGATTNDRATATKVAEGITSARHSGVANGVTWYYWIKARDYLPSAQGGPGYGPFHPTSATGGVSGTEATATQVTLSGLTAVANVSQVSLQWAITDPSTTGLGYLGLAAVEVWAASTNDRAGASKVTEGLTSAVHDGVPEGSTRYYWVRPRNRNGTYGSFFPSGTTSGVASTARDAVGIAFGGLANGKIVASVSSNALTVAIKSAAGNDPSASDPDIIYTALPNATVSNGSYQIRQITAALSLTISSGSTMGYGGSSVSFRLWLILIDDAGTLRLGLIKCIDINRYQIYPLRERTVSSTAEGGAGAADSNGVVYTGTAVTAKPFRVLGYLEWSTGLATAGTWDAAPDIIRLQGIGDPLPGDVVQVAKTTKATEIVSNTTTIPLDNTAPQSSEGSELSSWAISLAATSLANVLDYEASVSVSNHTGSLHMIGAVFYDSEASAYASDAVKIDSADDIARLNIQNRFYPVDLSSHSYKVRVGGSAAGTWTVNGVNNAGRFGSGLPTAAAIREVMA